MIKTEQSFILYRDVVGYPEVFAVGVCVGMSSLLDVSTSERSVVPLTTLCKACCAGDTASLMMTELPTGVEAF